VQEAAVYVSMAERNIHARSVEAATYVTNMVGKELKIYKRSGGSNICEHGRQKSNARSVEQQSM
jgi:hypothetical protein